MSLSAIRTLTMLLLSTLFTAACTGKYESLAGPVPEYVPDPTSIGPELDYITFGSCLSQDKPQPILDTIVADRPDLFIFLGDNIYADTDEPDIIADKYRKLAARPGFKKLRATTPLIATWDDHDYGQNDIGIDYIAKQASRELMLDFWDVPRGTPRWSRQDGIYGAYEFGPPARRVQIILLDLRWNRSALNAVSRDVYDQQRAPEKMGPYLPVVDSTASMLGEAQWQWLETELQKPAKLRILASSIQLLADFTGWESWANFPGEKQRLFNLLNRYAIDNLIVISGDTHWAEISRAEVNKGQLLWDITSSGLTETWKDVSPNQYRDGISYVGANYGYVRIDWQQAVPQVETGIKDVNGNIIMSRLIHQGVPVE
jgi:alkaline phosphatase D